MNDTTNTTTPAVPATPAAQQTTVVQPPQPAAQNAPAANAVDILPAQSDDRINQIISSGEVNLTTGSSSWGVILQQIEAKAREEQTQAKPKAETGQGNQQPVVTASVPDTEKKIAEVKDFSREQLSRIIEAKTGRDFPENATDKQILDVLTPAGVAKDGKIDVVKLVEYSQSRWPQYNGKAFDEKTLGDANVKYIQNLLGVTDDGVIGPRTLRAAEAAGIIKDGKLNTQAIDIIESNKLLAIDGQNLVKQANDNVLDPQTRAMQEAARIPLAWGMGQQQTSNVAAPNAPEGAKPAVSQTTPSR
jgi:hypothetical protein